MYKALRTILFIFPTEWVHHFSMNMLKFFCSSALFKKWIQNSFQPKSAENIHIFNTEFNNRVGLGAGFDKNARYLRELECLGFGSVEIGTVTPVAQSGNPKQRLFRLPKDKALINRMGFNNDGAEVIAVRLKKWRERSSVVSRQSAVNSRKMIIGGNIGKNKATANEEAWKDYEICFKILHPYVDYFVVNVSSPNTPGLRELQEKESLRKIFLHLHMINNGKAFPKPILLKIAPDLGKEQVDEVIALALEIKLDGLVVSNTTISRAGLKTDENKLKAIGAGGLSGLPLKARSTELVKYICERTHGQLPVIASGGIFTAQDAKEKIEAGAALVQVWTGFIYEGPGITKRICKNL
jgi:dihydroorotate dehydrogenase